jgi:hypothetical protein
MRTMFARTLERTTGKQSRHGDERERMENMNRQLTETCSRCKRPTGSRIEIAVNPVTGAETITCHRCIAPAPPAPAPAPAPSLYVPPAVGISSAVLDGLRSDARSAAEAEDELYGRPGLEGGGFLIGRDYADVTEIIRTTIDRRAVKTPVSFQHDADHFLALDAAFNAEASLFVATGTPIRPRD